MTIVTVQFKAAIDAADKLRAGCKLQQSRAARLRPSTDFGTLQAACGPLQSLRRTAGSMLPLGSLRRHSTPTLLSLEKGTPVAHRLMYAPVPRSKMNLSCWALPTSTRKPDASCDVHTGATTCGIGSAAHGLTVQGAAKQTALDHQHAAVSGQAGSRNRAWAVFQQPACLPATHLFPADIRGA